MSYQALYRKYRPQTFDDVVGQQAIVQTLKNAIIQDRIAHAYLFCGPRGTGKTSIAKIFARMLNCTSDTDRPCGHCENCKMALSGSHPDIIEIDAASNNGVDEVRNLIERVKYAPMEGKYKVYIIDEVHMMTKGAFNALLKTIEEPPKHVMFIFATTEPNKVIPTIISRCQRFDFTKVSKADIHARLDVVCASEKIDIEPEAIDMIATLADGGMRDALSILDQCVAFCSSTIKEEDVRQIYGVVTIEDIGEIYASLLNKQVEDVMERLQEISNQGMDLKRFTTDFISLIKDSIIVEYAPNTTLVNIHRKEIIQKNLYNTSLVFRINLLDTLMDTFNKFTYASNILDYLEAGLLKVITQSYEDISVQKEAKSDNQNHIFDAKKSDSSHELPSEQADKKENKGEVSDKTVDLKNDSISDVSRETLKESDTKNSKIILENEYLLQLLAGANKKNKIEDSKKYEKRKEIISDVNMMRVITLLENSTIFASSDTYVLLCVPSDLEANEINIYEKEHGFENEIEKILGVPKKVFAMDQNQQKSLVQLYMERRKNNTLPEPIHLDVRFKHKEEKEENTIEKDLKSVFPDLIIKED